MLIFLDTANLEEIDHANRLGVLRGVTTNPSLAAKEGIDDTANYRQVVQEIADIVDGPVSAEVISTSVEGMVAEGIDIATWAPNVVVKIPSTLEGLEAISILSKQDIKINQTLCFSVNQALLGALAGSSFVSPFVGRLDDEGHDGMQLVRDMVQIFQDYDFGDQGACRQHTTPPSLRDGGRGEGGHSHHTLQGAASDDAPSIDGHRCGTVYSGLAERGQGIGLGFPTAKAFPLYTSSIPRMIRGRPGTLKPKQKQSTEMPLNGETAFGRTL